MKYADDHVDNMADQVRSNVTKACRSLSRRWSVVQETDDHLCCSFIPVSKVGRLRAAMIIGQGGFISEGSVGFTDLLSDAEQNVGDLNVLMHIYPPPTTK